MPCPSKLSCKRRFTVSSQLGIRRIDCNPGADFPYDLQAGFNSAYMYALNVYAVSSMSYLINWSVE
jgi:hypothetical protein